MPYYHNYSKSNPGNTGPLIEAENDPVITDFYAFGGNKFGGGAVTGTDNASDDNAGDDTTQSDDRGFPDGLRSGDDVVDIMLITLGVGSAPSPQALTGDPAGSPGALDATYGLSPGRESAESSPDMVIGNGDAGDADEPLELFDGESIL